MSVTYLDANAGARLRTTARLAIESFLSASPQVPANPSSIHSRGREARRLLSEARRSVVQLLTGDGRGMGSARSEHFRVVFTSGGTEAITSLHLGFFPFENAGRPIGNRLSAPRIVVSAIEHEVTKALMSQYRERGCVVTEIAAKSNGAVPADEFIDAVFQSAEVPALVSLIAANNVTGIIQPVVEVTRELRKRGYKGVILSDAVQLLGKSELTPGELLRQGVDGVAISGHKLGALSGIGAFIINESEVCHTFSPFLAGGAQEERFRGGTENLLGAISFGAAAEEFRLNAKGELSRMRLLRDQLADNLRSSLNELEIITPAAPIAQKGETPITKEPGITAVCNTLCLRVRGVRADDLVVALDLQGVCASTGSACASGRQEVSHVYSGMGFSDDAAAEAIRFSIDWATTEAEIVRASEIITEVIARIRK